MFPCTQCGLCCSYIGDILKEKESVYQQEINEFPYEIKDGKCEKQKGKICTVYDNRPKMCDIEFMTKKYDLKEKEIIDACNALIIANHQEQYLIK